MRAKLSFAPSSVVWLVVAAVLPLVAAATTLAQEHVVSEIGSERATSGAGGKIVTFEGKTHVVWQDAADDGTYPNRIRTLDHATGNWSEPFTLNRGVDNHARPVVTVGSEGFLHVVLSGHNTATSYRKSLRPNDASAWQPEEPIGAGTYPSLVAAKNGELHVSLRNPRRWNGVDLYRKQPSGPWEKQAHLVKRDPQLKGYGAFHNGLAWGPGGRTLHSIHDFYESKDVMKDRGVHQAVCYMRSRDGGATWQRVDGTQVATPARPEQIDILTQSRGSRHEPTPPPIVLAQGSIVVDADDRPHVLYVSHIDQPGQVIHATTDSDGTWRQDPINELVEAFPDHRPIGCRGSWSIDSQGTLFGLLQLVPFPGGWVDGQPSRKMTFEPAGKRLVWLVSKDNGATFDVSPALEAGTIFNEPNLERPVGFNQIEGGRRPAFLYFDGESRYREQGEILQNNVLFRAR